MNGVRNRRCSKTIRPLVVKTVNSRITVEEALDSPNQGVPPPIDQKLSIRFEDSSSESNSCTDIEIMGMKSANQYLSAELKSKIAEYKNNSKIHINEQLKVIKKASSVQDELETIKGSLEEVLTETNRTKDQLKEMREIVDLSIGERSRDGKEKTGEEDGVPEIKDLISLVQNLNQRLNIYEEEIKSKEAENEYMKGTIEAIHGNLIEIKNEKLIKRDGACKCQIC